MNRKLIINSKITLSDIIIILLCLQMWNTYTILLGFSTVLRWGMVFCIGIQMVFNKKHVLHVDKKSLGQKLWLIMLIYFWLGSLYSLNKNATISYCISITTATILLYVVLRPKFYKKCLEVFYAILIFSLITIYLNFIIHNLMTNYLAFCIPDSIRPAVNLEVSSGVYSGIFADRANAAFALNIGFAISYAKSWIEEKKKNKKKYLILTVLFFIGILVTGKRTLALIPIIIILMSMILKTKNKKNQIILSIMISISVVLLIILTFTTDLSSLFMRKGSDDIFNSRSSILWPIAFKMFNGHKLFGTGINTYNTIINNDYWNNATLSSWINQAHNIYIYKY